MTEVYIVSINPRYQTESTAAYYDGDATLDEIMKDLEANHYKIRSVEYAKKGSMNTFLIKAE